MLNIYSKEEWAIDAKKALNFLINQMGDENWNKRRLGVINYFREVENIQFGVDENTTDKKEKFILPIAMYSDWIAWYMYLVESIFQRPSCGDALQSARIFPFFSMIGKNLSTLLQIDGIEKKIDELLNDKRNQPDSILFELAVANLYCKNHWKVCFIPESTFYKSPDLQVRKDGEAFWIECKRMDKPTYSEIERKEWQNRSLKLSFILKKYNFSYLIDITFKIPVADTHEDILVTCFNEYLKTYGGQQTGKIITSQIEINIIPLNIHTINKELEKRNIRNNSPELIEICIGKYESGGNYVTTTDYDKLYKLGMDDNLDVLNLYIEKVKSISVMKWISISEYSINMKAKDIKRNLVKAVNQIPEDGQGIIHIGYENLDGPYVERRRYRKIQETIEEFDFKGKDIQAIFCNSIQLLATSTNFDWAETAAFYKAPNHPSLKSNLLLAESVAGFNRPHWEDDISNIENDSY